MSQIFDVEEIEETGVYAIVCDINGWVYVGATQCGFSTRWLQHIEMLEKQRHWIKPLQSDWNQYGQSAFSFLILDSLSEDDIGQIGASEWDWMKHVIDAGPSYNRGAGRKCAYVHPNGKLCRNLSGKAGSLCPRHAQLVDEEERRSSSSVTYYPINKSLALTERDFIALQQLAKDWKTSMGEVVRQLIREEERRRERRLRAVTRRMRQTP